MIGALLVRVLSDPGAIIAAAAPFIGEALQDNAARLQAEAEHRQSEKAKAISTSNEISNAMDTFAFLNNEAMYAVVFRGSERPEEELQLTQEQDQQTWKEYRAAFKEWEEAKTRYFAETYRYFGKEIAEKLRIIQNDFGLLAAQVSAVFYKRRESRFYIEDQEGSENDFRTKYFPIRKNALEKMQEINMQMLYCIQTGNFGVFDSAVTLRTPKPLQIKAKLLQQL